MWVILSLVILLRKHTNVVLVSKMPLRVIFALDGLCVVTLVKSTSELSIVLMLGVFVELVSS